MVIYLPNGNTETVLDINSCKKLSREILGDDLFGCLVENLQDELNLESEKHIKNVYCCDCEEKRELEYSLDKIKDMSEIINRHIKECLENLDNVNIKESLEYIKDRIDMINEECFYY